MKHFYLLLIAMVLLFGCEYPFSSGGTPIPVATYENQSFTLSGYYDVTVNNLSSEDLNLWFEVPAKGRTNFVLPANGAKVFGSEYNVQKNTTYSVGGEGYATVTRTVF